MSARRVVTTACLLGLAGLVGTSADASPAPAPTVSVVTYVATGTALPATTVSAAWSRVSPGCGGRLAASGAVLSGTSTVMQGVFTSRAFRPRGGLIGLVGLSEDGRTIMKPFPQGMSVAFRTRDVGHAWSRWWSFSVTTDPEFPPSLLTYSTEGGSIALFELAPRGRRPLQQVQIRLRDQITRTGLADDRFDVAIGC